MLDTRRPDTTIEEIAMTLFLSTRTLFSISVAFGLLLGPAGCNEKQTTDDAPSESVVIPQKGTAAPSTAATAVSDLESAGSTLKGAIGGKLGDAEAAITRELASAAKSVAGVVNDKPSLGDDEFRQLIVAHAACNLTEKGDIEYDCPAVKAMQDAMSGRTFVSNALGGRSALGIELIDHASPAVKLKAIHLMDSYLNASDEGIAAAVKAMQHEQHAAVLSALVWLVRNGIGKNPEVADALTRLSTHASPLVRKRVAAVWSMGDARAPADRVQRLHDLVQHDASEEVRMTACREMGKRGDERHLPIYVALTARGASTDELRHACLEGLSEMWWNWPFLTNTNETAYRLSLARYMDKPRTARGLSRVAGAVHMTANGYNAFRARAPWFNPGELRWVMADIILDSNVDWLTKKGAIDSLSFLKASKAEAETIRAKFADSGPGSKWVREALDKLVMLAPETSPEPATEPNIDWEHLKPTSATTAATPTHPETRAVAEVANERIAAPAEEAVGPSQDARYTKGQKVDVLWHERWYAGSILDVAADGRTWKITYEGWDASWDEWVGADRLRER